MTVEFKRIKDALSRLYLKFSQRFAGNGEYYSIMSQQDYQMSRMRDI